MNKKIYAMFSLCQKAGKMISGEFAVEKALQNKTAKLIIIALDVSDNTREKFENKAVFYKTDFLHFGTKDELSGAIGKFNRAVFAIIDEGFANKINVDIKGVNDEG